MWGSSCAAHGYRQLLARYAVPDHVLLPHFATTPLPLPPARAERNAGMDFGGSRRAGSRQLHEALRAVRNLGKLGVRG